MIFQDSENAPIGDFKGLKPERVYESAVEEIFVRCSINIHEGATKPKVRWTTFFPPIDPDNPWHCSQRSLTALRTQGVLTVQCGDKKGDVDTQMKDAMATYMDDFASVHPKERKAKTLMVLLSGTLNLFQNNATEQNRNSYYSIAPFKCILLLCLSLCLSFLRVSFFPSSNFSIC